MQRMCRAGAFGLFLTVWMAQAQEVVRAPDRSMRTYVPGVEALAVPGMPFSAATTTDWVRTLPDGNTVTRHLNATMARDSSGRVYRERRHFATDATHDAPLYETTVVDPVSQTEMTCVVATRQCTVRSFRPRTHVSVMQPGPLPNGAGTLIRDALGTSTLQGLNVVGTRETMTLNPGVAGNSGALVRTKEFWYAPELQINLAVTRTDPTEGQQTVRLSSVSRTEPEAARFAPPPGFSVQVLPSTAVPQPQP